MSAFDEVLEAEKRLAEVELELAERTDYESDAYMDLIHEITELNDKLADIGGRCHACRMRKNSDGSWFQSY